MSIENERAPKLKETLDLLRDWLESEFDHVELVEQKELRFLRFFPALYVDGSGQVIMEVCLYDHGPEGEFTVAQVYTTVFLGIEANEDALRERIPQWNFTSMAGSYGIYETQEHQKQLYHKHNVALVTDADVEDQVDFLFTGICLALDEIASRFPEAVDILIPDAEN